MTVTRVMSIATRTQSPSPGRHHPRCIRSRALTPSTSSRVVVVVVNHVTPRHRTNDDAWTTARRRRRQRWCVRNASGEDDGANDDIDPRVRALDDIRQRWARAVSSTEDALRVSSTVTDAAVIANENENDYDERLVVRESTTEETTTTTMMSQSAVVASNSTPVMTTSQTGMVKKSARNARLARALTLTAGTLVVFGSMAQGSSVDGTISLIVRRLVSIYVIRFIFRRVYYILRDAASAARALYDGPVRRARDRAWSKFRGDLKGMLLIPVVAASVGWFTNWLAVKMIFYPIGFWGLPLLQYVEGQVYGFDILQPLGFFGWQGIVPAKAAAMSLTMVTMVTDKLVNVQEVFRLLDPAAVSALLLTEVPAMATSIASDMIPGWAVNLAQDAVPALPSAMLNEVSSVVSSYLAGFVTLLQQQVDAVIDLKELVVTAMCTDRVVMVDLFRQCGAKELDFLVNSGLFFGFLLGVIQMVVWAFYDNPWSITAGGAVVGLLTNWLALKCIFEPVEPIFVGPFKLQGLFLQRQQEVSGTFSDYLTSKVLKSERIWDNMLHGAKGPEFKEMLETYTKDFVVAESAARGMSTDGLDVTLIEDVATKVAEQLPNHIGVLHEYTDDTLGLQTLIREKMKLMSPAEFERVLHPIFEQDELTLIISGAVLGAIAGYIQQVSTVKQDPKDDNDEDNSKIDSSTPETTT